MGGDSDTGDVPGGAGGPPLAQAEAKDDNTTGRAEGDPRMLAAKAGPRPP